MFLIFDFIYVKKSFYILEVDLKKFFLLTKIFQIILKINNPFLFLNMIVFY